MKNLKIFAVTFLALSLALSASSSKAQTHPTTYPVLGNVNQGQYIDIGGINMVPRDSLLVTDTATYIVPVTHVNDLTHYLTLNWQKIGSGTATVKVAFFQGNDPTYLSFPVLKGLAQSAYTKTYTFSASGQQEISFIRDTAQFSGRYLKIQLTTSSTASVKGKYAMRLKTNIK